MIDMKLLQQLYKPRQKELMAILDTTPKQVMPVVIQSDARIGFIVRYFVRQVNDISFIVEVDRKQYDDFKENPRFIVTKLNWKIVGKKETVYLQNNTSIYGVEDQNKLIVSEADLTFGGLGGYINNYLEYWLAEG
jgi:predicted transcriptional regulator